MIKNVSTQFNETQIIETLDNGLTVVIVSKPDFLSNTAVLGTHYGAVDLSQNVGGEVKHYHAGIAHFLEHKLFEQEDEDILSVFTNMGASANAFTSYNETVYYFTNVNDIEKPLNLLLDFVQSLSITSESVEKEKGIIIEELKMYQQQPSFQLSMETLRSLYHEHALKYDIAGTEDSVSSITKEELESAYQTNYHPSQLVLSVVTHYSPEEILEMVKKNQATKEFVSLEPVTPYAVNEPAEVVRKYYELEMNVKTPKVSVAFKQVPDYESYYDLIKSRLSMRFLLEMTFTNLNPEYQRWLDEKLVNNYFNFQNHVGMDFGYIQFVSESDDHEQFAQFIADKLSGLKISEEILKQLVRRTLGESILDLQDFESLAIDGLRSQFMKVNLFDIVNMAGELTVEDLEKARKSINLDQKVVIKLKSMEK